jgi:hypothetical protein
MPIPYSKFSPTQFDPHQYLEDREDWLVAPASRTRDSGVLTESNWEAQLAALDHVRAEYEIHRWGHWGPGWFEIVLVHPDHSEVVESLEYALEDYPVLDDSDYSNREQEAVFDYWGTMTLKERIRLCSSEGASTFAARRDTPPVECFDRITYWVNEG